MDNKPKQRQNESMSFLNNSRNLTFFSIHIHWYLENHIENTCCYVVVVDDDD